MTPEEESDIRSIYSTWSEVYVLKNKANDKELDPRFFYEAEKKSFDKSDAAEWTSWLSNEVVNVLTPEEEKKVPRHLVFTAPLRYVRTNKAKGGAQLIAKSRLIIPGHLDPQLGTFRTDAPTTSSVAVHICVAIAAAKGWHGWTFDVSTAFLSGKETQRRVYIRAPKEGLPSVNGKPEVRPGQLIEILKGAYGLAEAPRLWYLRAREVLAQLGWTELQCARATFVLRVDDEPIATMNLHVDDGIVFGDKQDQRVKNAIQKLNESFHIKEWKDIEQGFTYLGAQWKKHPDGTITQEMNNYVVNEVKQIDPKTEPSQREFRSPLMKVSWPIRHVLPQLAYAASHLATRVKQPTQEDARLLHLLINEAKWLADQGLVKLTYRKIDLQKIVVVTNFDASFGKEEGMKSQSGFITYVTDESIKTMPTLCSIVEFQSCKIDRVVKSTMAAESAALSKALDRQLYTRLLIEAILHGEPEYTRSWRHKLRVPGIVVTDAKSLYDHLNATGSVPAERQTLIDLLIARDLAENKALEIRWVPTMHQLADCLTKMMKVPPTMQKFLTDNTYCLTRSREEQEQEDHLKGLRQGQRQRRKLRLKVNTAKLDDPKNPANEA